MGLRYSLISAKVLLVVFVVGCGQSPQASIERYIPDPDTARSAIASALSSWQKGEPTGELAGTSQPLLFVVDSHRKPGQKLDQFEILGEVPGHTKRCYLVKLSYSNPTASEKARYAVVGIDPLWIYRHEDLEMLAHWEHPMPPPNAKQSTEPSAADPSPSEVRP